MLNVAFILADSGISGGVNVIFQHALNMINSGIKVAIVSKSIIKHEEVKWHPIESYYDDPRLLWLDYSNVVEYSFDIAIATWWRTFFDLWKIQAKNYAYFVQSIESRFYSDTEKLIRLAVDSTYDIPIGFITEASWIKNYISKIHDHQCEYAPNGIDKDLFTPFGPAVAPREKGRLRVLVEGPIDVWFKNVPESIKLARKADVNEVWLLTSSDVKSYPLVDRLFSRVNQKNLGAIYRSCDVILKLSYVEGMFGPPLEMFHCGGTCIVYDVSGHEEYIKNGFNGIIIKKGDEGKVKQALRHLRLNQEFLNNLQRNALTTAMSWPNWKVSSDQFINGVEKILSRKTVSRKMLRNHTQRIWNLVEVSWQISTERDRLLAECSTERDRLLAEYDQIINSRSWKITSPMRLIMNKIRYVTKR